MILDATSMSALATPRKHLFSGLAHPFIGVRISCDILAKNSDLDLFASSAASLAIVFFCRLSRNEKTILLIFVFKESISPEASTVTNELKSPSVAAAEI